MGVRHLHRGRLWRREEHTSECGSRETMTSLVCPRQEEEEEEEEEEAMEEDQEEEEKDLTWMTMMRSYLRQRDSLMVTVRGCSSLSPLLISHLSSLISHPFTACLPASVSFPCLRKEEIGERSW